MFRGRKTSELKEIPDLLEEQMAQTYPDSDAQAPLPKQLTKRLEDMKAAYNARREKDLRSGSKQEVLYQQYRIVGLLMTGHFKPFDIPRDAWGVFARSRSKGLVEGDGELAEDKFAQMGLIDKKLEGYRKAVKDLDAFLKGQKKE